MTVGQSSNIALARPSARDRVNVGKLAHARLPNPLTEHAREPARGADRGRVGRKPTPFLASPLPGQGGATPRQPRLGPHFRARTEPTSRL